MVNLKYPSGLKGKSYIGWLGALFAGVAPLVFYRLGAAHLEHQSGEEKRATNGEPHFYHYLLSTDYNNSVLGRELLNHNPCYEYGIVDRKRLSLDAVKNASTKI